MLNNTEFRKIAHQVADWIADYWENVEHYPVKSQVKPREIYEALPEEMPANSEDFSAIWQDFQQIILKGITHWQSPNFFAYFPANSSYESLLAEMLTAAMGAQCMIWETSPAAAELEEKMMNWLKKACGLPETWSGVIQDTASSATLCALLSAREKFSDFQINEKGFESFTNFRVYASVQTHSSIEKAVKIAGIGKENFVQVPCDEHFAIRTDLLEKLIEADWQDDKKPLCIVATLGTTSSTAFDDLEKLSEIAQKHHLWLHVDAAYAGTAFLLPEFRHYLKGIEKADSYVFNPHKWMFVNFDCSAYFVKEKEWLIRTFEILPEYLKTQNDSLVNNYRDWGIPLGRRFRALKLWFVMRSWGLRGLQKRLREHIQLAQDLTRKIATHPDFEILAPTTLNLICFRYKPTHITDENLLNTLNEKLLQTLNATGKVYMSHTKLNGKYTLRMVVAQTYVLQKHILNAWQLIQERAEKLQTDYLENF
ncbi:pyridoxal phosphate-dependent decarboxylase family protein [Raineya orbicola]|uniref:Glutamate decarboxylase and PLP-dependent-like protein n=1 Tax=Raineya orbicola TaxID=2016530 RepID=A0A2N3IG57_9BACT|nr:aminotransferase class I/II-fold pyridoxal phosphate-dependent enzyme [Raineya orbicola]PKQ69306.1 Glutamate decarboxylase and PLP-dependent-like protein [Raineya orbicola]